MDRTPEAKRIAATTSSSISSSPAVQESPFSNFLSNLSPLNTATTASYTQTLLGTNLPTPPVVFTSPHINLQRETSFLERDDIVEAGSEVYKECNTNIVQIQNPSFEEVQLCSPSGCVDEYLADPVEVDSTCSADLRLQRTNEVPQLLHSGFAPGKESNTEVCDIMFGSPENEAVLISDQAEKDLPLSSLEMSQAAINQRDGKKTEELSRFIFEKVKESDVNACLVSRAQNGGEIAAKVNLQRAGCQYDEKNASSQSCHSNEGKKRVQKGLVKEGGQNERGIRRHLQFEAAKAYKFTILGNSESPCSLTHDATNSRSPSILTNLKSLASSHFDNRASSSPQDVRCDTSQFPSSPYESFTSAQIGVNSTNSAPIHSGIGLHLNHISRSTSLSSDIFSSKKSTRYLRTPEQMLEHGSNNIATNSSSILTSAVSGKIYVHVASGQQESQAATEASSFTFHSTDTMKPPCHSMLVDQEAGLCEVGMSASQEADEVEELNQLSPKRKRRKDAYMSEGCKRCNCRRSKCLKLYCECFAAGVYCVDSCACVNCYNKPEFEDTVLDIRQQIEARNPLAFTPKVVDNAIDSSPNFMHKNSTGRTGLDDPILSQAQERLQLQEVKVSKKYCECFQAKVGCSSACRCEGCKNTFGVTPEPVYDRAKRWEAHPAEKLDNVKGAIACIKAPGINHYSPTWEGISDISKLTPLSHPCSHTAFSSASSSNSAKIPQAQLPSSQLQPSGAHYDIPYDDTPEILKETSNPTKVVKASSPNQKRVSPPQSRSRLRERSPTGLRSGRKFVLQAMPSFPPLTPHRNSKEGTNEIENDDK
ncbi:protein tesmin/TSO1-like CXC 3 isoform X4 [Prunus yedoensis var. nudiflora]|uniref:Protein tesmin/TSO1-like CXC 3 isoform X4 n=1 Tax=Prunus yedoensis var. nudiflora TaxID=2094558 RepID=A0A314ZUY8_PRUYE|nr:protein tesmin/TSO1-like CXC 3 isoform X4 [Prunus yedoensis var. nudiflora]